MQSKHILTQQFLEKLILSCCLTTNFYIFKETIQIAEWRQQIII